MKLSSALRMRLFLTALAPLLLIIVFMGVYPKPIFDRMEPSVTHLVQHIEEHTDYREPGVARKGPEVVPVSERHSEEASGQTHADEHGDATENGEGGH